jgi:hypothetical protein
MAIYRVNQDEMARLDFGIIVAAYEGLLLPQGSCL